MAGLAADNGLVGRDFPWLGLARRHCAATDALAAYLLDCDGLGVEDIHGVAQVPGTPYVVANSGRVGIIAIDTRNGAKAGFAPVMFYEAQHLYHTAT